jgi:hypothetical protein
MASLWRCAKRAASARRSVPVGGGEVVFVRATQALRVLKTPRFAAGIASVQNRSLPEPPIWRMQVHAERHRRAGRVFGFHFELFERGALCQNLGIQTALLAVEGDFP